MDQGFFEHLSSVARSAIADELLLGLVPGNKDLQGYDPVTEADLAVERSLRSAIEERFPDHGIWGEEFGMTRPKAALRWSIDPVDGTRALVCGLASWAILVGLLENGHHIAGMIDLPAIDDRLIAVGGHTLRNGAAVRTSGCTSIADARLSTTDPNIFGAARAAAFERVRREARLTRFGLDAMAYARIATGDMDLVIEDGLKPHDYDALVAVIRGAGGTIGNWSGGEDLGGGDVVAAATRSLYDRAIALLAG
jgi:myo-inositol-1(or 4)-monophosphatase